MMICVATLMLGLASCSSSSSTTSGNDYSAAKNYGKNTGKAIVALYNSYKTNKTISLSNSSDLTNTLLLASGYANMRNNRTDNQYKAAFAAGMVSAGGDLITEDNVTTLIDKMNGLTGLNVNAANISQSASTVSSVIQILQMLGGTAQ